jgi:opacity protein-like surface antigen
MKNILLASAALLALSAAPASAAIVTLNIFGTASNIRLAHTTSGPDGVDREIVFTDLPNRAYQATASFDLIFNTSGVASYQLVGFSSNLGGEPNYNFTRTEASSFALTFQANQDYGPGGAIYLGNSYTEFRIAGAGLTRNGDLSTLNLAAFDPSESGGNFYWDKGKSYTLNNDGDDFYQSSGNLSIEEVSFPVVAAVPEPASWALMIGGFSLVGGTLRRRSLRPSTTRVAFA